MSEDHPEFWEADIVVGMDTAQSDHLAHRTDFRFWDQWGQSRFIE